MNAANLFVITLDSANKLYAWGWGLSVTGAVITMIGIASLWMGTRVRDQNFEENIANLHESAAKSEERSKELEQSNLTLQRDIERERGERVRLEEKFSRRGFSEEQRAIVLSAFKGIRGRRAYVRCIDEIEACLAAHNFAAVLREAGLDVPEVEGVGMTFPATTGIEVYDPTGEEGLFAKTLLSVLPDARFRPGPFHYWRSGIRSRESSNSCSTENSTTTSVNNARCAGAASATKIVRPREPTAETQPPTPTGFAEIVSDYFPILHAGQILPLLLSTQQ